MGNAATLTRTRGAWSLTLWRIGVALCIFLAWEYAGWRMGASSWISQPSAIVLRLGAWAGDDLWLHVATTLWEMALGLAIGVPLGVISGLLLGRSPILSDILRPIITAIYNVPLIAIAPLLILWFGLDLTPKVVLVAIVTYFILFFATFSGAESMDRDLIAMLRIMGATPGEEFFKVVLPASMAWIAAAMRLALPYALIDAIMGEILAARRGLGYLLTNAVSQIDMTGVYASLVVMMIIGISMVELATRVERAALKWRPILN
ncbi:MAG: ABC transporter permease [Burkholderiaceae bacterium]|nr:ABC transporter permease [Burkholderiaceae bacterium]